MTMDVYGKNPQSETGRHFLSDILCWQGLAEYVHLVAPEIVENCIEWCSNDAYGLEAQDALELADMLEAELISGRCETYTKIRKAELDSIGETRCYLCGGEEIIEAPKELPLLNSLLNGDSKIHVARDPSSGDLCGALVGCSLPLESTQLSEVIQSAAWEDGELIECVVCHGTGFARDLEARRQFSVQNVRDFVAFLRQCGGFEIR